MAFLLTLSLLLSSSVQAPSDINTDNLLIIQGNTLKATVPVFALKFAPLGDFIGEDDIFIVQKLIECESGGNPYICGDKGTSCGILQFKKSTFNLYCQGEWLNSQDQIRCALEMLNKSLGYHWTCYRKIQ